MSRTVVSRTIRIPFQFAVAVVDFQFVVAVVDFLLAAAEDWLLVEVEDLEVVAEAARSVEKFVF
jgi:hypothetical protein